MKILSLLLLAFNLFASDIPVYINAGNLRCGWIQRPEDHLQVWCYEGIVFNNQTLRCNSTYYLPPTGENAYPKCEWGPDKIEWIFTLNGTVITYSVQINGVSIFTITTQFLPSCTVNSPYAAKLVATGGDPPYTWSMLWGTLPDGLILTSDGLITGTPTKIGNYEFAVLVKDSSGFLATYPPIKDSITVASLK